MSKPPLVETNDRIAVDKNPTAEKEAQDFDNEDERRARAHELNLLRMKQGYIGKITGSSNEQFNNGVFVFLLLIIMLGGTELLLSYHPSERLSGIPDNLLKVIFAVVGYLFATSRGAP